MKNKHFTGRFRQRFAFICLLGLLSAALTGCQTRNSIFPNLDQEGLHSGANWAVLPFISHTNIPEDASTQLERIIMVQLPSIGINKPTIYRAPETNTTLDYLSDIYEVERARLWAINNHISHSISGEILEWKYDEQNRFSTMLSLKVTDIASGEVVWDINGLGEGRPGESAYEVSRKLIVDLLAAMPVQEAK